MADDLSWLAPVQRARLAALGPDTIDRTMTMLTVATGVMGISPEDPEGNTKASYFTAGMAFAAVMTRLHPEWWAGWSEPLDAVFLAVLAKDVPIHEPALQQFVEAFPVSAETRRESEAD